MEPDKVRPTLKQKKAASEGFEGARPSRESGGPRKPMLRRRLAEPGDGAITAGHGEEPSPELSYDSPWGDRAG